MSVSPDSEDLLQTQGDGDDAASDEGHLEWPTLRAALLQRLCSPAARSRWPAEGRPPASTPGLDPFSPRQDLELDAADALARAQARLDELDELERLLQSNPHLGGLRSLAAVEPVEHEVGRAARGVVLSPAELLAIGEGLAVALTVVDALHPGQATGPKAYPALSAALAGLAPPVGLARQLARSVAREGPRGEPWLTDGASGALSGLRARVRTQRAALQRHAESLLRKPSLADAFADRYVTEREGRVVLPLRASAVSPSGAPGTLFGLIHDASHTGQTVFVEPQDLIDDNNALRGASLAVRQEEARILAELSEAVGAHGHAILDTVAALARLDSIGARLLLSQAVGGVRPKLFVPTPTACLELPAARHPIMVLRGREVVANDLRVDLGQALIVSGPNAGGKTVALKTLGLCVLMARVGVRVPTSAAGSVPLFGAVVTDVGDDQSIARDLSTFSAHIRHVVRACTAARRNGAATLVLLDEVAVGTDPDQGAAMAEAIVRDLVEHGATVVVTTHYERLKLLATLEPERYQNAAVGFDLATLRSTFRLHLGIPGSSSALQVAGRLGLPPEVLQRTAAALSEGRLSVDRLLIEVAALRERLVDREQALVRDQAELAALRGRLEALEKGEVERASTRLARAHAQAVEELRSLRVQIREAKKGLRIGVATAEQLSGAAGVASRAAGELEEHRPRADSPAGQPLPEPVFGARVRIERLGVEGTVVAVRGAKVTVQLPHMRTTVDAAELRAGKVRGSSARPIQPKPRPGDDNPGRHFGADARPVEANLDNVADLRGARYEEAVSLLESFLARAIEADQEVVILRHGHGTGAVRKAVRERLPQLAHVVRHRAGLPAEGGDGVTVVWVRP